MQLQHVDVADRHLALERLARATIGQYHLAGRVQPGFDQHAFDVRHARAIEHRGCDRHALAQVFRQFHQLFGGHVGDLLAIHLLAIHVAQCLQKVVAACAGAAVFFHQFADLLAESGAGPTQMGFQDLPHVHAARHAQRVQHDIDMRAIFQERHVFHRRDTRHHALVAMTTGHLIARLQLALHRHEHLDHLHHARRAVRRHAAAFPPCCRNAPATAPTAASNSRFSVSISAINRVVLHHHVAPRATRMFGQNFFVDIRTGLDALEAGTRLLSHQPLTQPVQEAGVPGWRVRRRDPWPDARSPHDRSPSRVRPCPRRGG